ncbi:MAG: cysteine hydrolase [Candidatus Omnitrophica bacterium]|nr:cysteine hydrolase [Candidatus Omnitrophota bacterium]
MMPVLIIIDVQQDFFDKERLSKNRKKLTTNINELTQFARSKNIPVIFVRQEFKEDMSDAPIPYQERGYKLTMANTKGSQLLPELVKDKTDHEIIKKRYSAFFNTDLEKLLQKIKADTLIIGGINTHACVRTSAIDAYQRDYKVYLATDCIDSYDEKHHKISLEYLTGLISEGLDNAQLKSKFT